MTLRFPPHFRRAGQRFGLGLMLVIGLALGSGASTPPVGTGGLYFDGIDDYVTFGPAPGLGVSNFTVETWFLRLGPGSLGNTGLGGVSGVPLVSKGRGENDNDVTNCNFFLGIRGTNDVLTADFEDYATGANHPVAGTTAVQSNVWTHAAVTYNGTNWVIYLNGQSNGTASGGSATPRFDSIQHAALGSALTTGGTPQGFFDGVLDEARVWNYARTPAQISNSFQLQITNATGLIGRWSLDEISGTSVTNTGSSGVNGTKINGPLPAAGYPFGAPPPPNQPPGVPILVSPADNAANVSLTAALALTVSDPDTNTLTVTFFGRQKITNEAGPDFNIVALPDTQFYSASTNGGSPDIFQSQTDWIVANQEASNIVFVTHLGDIVNNGDSGGDDVEWLAAMNAMYRLEDPETTLLANGIPYGVTVGNHDQSPNGSATGTTTFFNQFFGVDHFSGFDYYGGNYGANNDNNFVLFSASGMDFILINLEYDTSPDAAVLNWADALLKTHSNRRAIITSHYIVNTGNPASFGTQGQAIYNALKNNRNLFLMLCGHIHGEGQRTDTFNNHTIWSVLSDYQGRTAGGNGWLRILNFSPSNNVIRFITYSPWLDQFEDDADSRFDMPYLMNMPDFAPLATNVSVASGAAASFNWANLATNTTHEWFAVVSDGSLSVTSAVFTFTTGDGNPTGSTPQLGDIIFNEYSSDNDSNGTDFFELLVLKNGLDLRGLRVTDNEMTNAATGQLNNGESVFVFGNDDFLANVPAGTLIAVYTSTNGVNVDTNLNPLAGDWKLVLTPGTGVTASTDGLGGSVSAGLSTSGEALYLYLPGPDGTSAGTDNIYLDYITWETSGQIAPTGVASVVFPAPADNGYFTGTTAAQADLTNNWVLVDSLISGAQTPGLPNPGQNLDALRGLPAVTLTSPTNGTIFAAGTPAISLSATASDSNGVAKVEFFANGNKLGEDPSSPFQFTWTNPPPGNHALMAVATDNDGFTNQSAAVNITVGLIVPRLVRGPYLQLGTPTNMTIRWRTDLAEASRVIYGTNLTQLNLTNIVASVVTNHQVRLSNLQPDTLYYYTVGSTTNALTPANSNYFLVTHPRAGTTKPTRIWVIGDAGRADANQTAVRDGFDTYNGTNRVDLWLQLGDNAYTDGTDVEFQAAVFNMYSNLLRRSVTWPTLGNHETSGSAFYTTNYPYFSMFTFPTNAEAGGVVSGTPHYYSFDYGMIHLVCLDSMTASRATNGQMADWLRLDLAANTNRWVIAFWHHPPYSKGSHDSDVDAELIEMRENFLPIIEAGGVDLVLSGHSHSYERSHLIKGHYLDTSTFDTNTMVVQLGGGRVTNGTGAYLKPEAAVGAPIGNRGTVYAVAGSSGAIGGGVLNHPAMFVSLNRLGSMVLDVTSNRLDAVFLRELGASPVTNDWFTIIKTNFAPAASNATLTIAADASTNLAVSGSDVNRNPISFAANAAPTNGLIGNFNPATGTFTYTPARGATNDSLTFTANDGQLNSPAGTITIQITPPIDLDGDGMADAWELANGVTDPNADPDGDGQSNLKEYRAGTNPNSALSWLRVTQINQAGAGYVITWSSVGGTRYRIRYSNGDANGNFNGVFTPIIRPVTAEMDPAPVGTLSTQTFTDDFTLSGGPSSTGKRYYRIDVVR